MWAQYKEVMVTVCWFFPQPYLNYQICAFSSKLLNSFCRLVCSCYIIFHIHIYNIKLHLKHVNRTSQKKVRHFVYYYQLQSDWFTVLLSDRQAMETDWYKKHIAELLLPKPYCVKLFLNLKLQYMPFRLKWYTVFFNNTHNLLII